MSEKKSTNKVLKEFLCDCSKQDMLYGSLIRSPVANRKITNITIKDFPEGYFLYTARDIPGENKAHIFDSKNRIFCNETVHYIGEPAGIVIGPDQRITKQLASQVQITFEITSIDSALHEISEHYNRPIIDIQKKYETENEITALAEKISISPSLDSLPKTNTICSYTKPEQISEILEKKEEKPAVTSIFAKRIVKKGAFSDVSKKEEIDEIFGNCFQEFSSEWTFEETSDDFFENLGALAKYENNKLTVLCPSQWHHLIKSNLSSILNISESKINIHTTKLHQVNQNGLHNCITLAAAAAIASIHSNLPVKIELSREEQKMYYSNALKTKLNYRTGLSQDGVIQAMMIKIHTDAGAQNPFASEIADRLAIASASLYSQENLFIESIVEESNNPPGIMNPNQIDSAAFFGIENHLNYIAKQTGFLPDEIRLKNFDRENQVFKFTIDKKNELIKKMMQIENFSRKYASYRLNGIKQTTSNSIAVDYIPKRGIGMACAYQGTYFYGTNFPNENIFVEVTLNLDGSVTIKSLSVSPSVIDAWKNIVSQILEIEKQVIKVETTIDYPKDSYPSSLLKISGLLTSLLKKCCADIQKKRFRNPLPISSKKVPSNTLKKNWNKEDFCGSPFFSSSFVSIAAEIQINPISYEISLEKLYVFFNCGEIISDSAINSAMQLGVQRELKKLGLYMPLDSEHFLLRYAPSSQNSAQISSLIHNALPAAITSAISIAISKEITQYPIDKKIIFDILKPKESLEDYFHEDN